MSLAVSHVEHPFLPGQDIDLPGSGVTPALRMPEMLLLFRLLSPAFVVLEVVFCSSINTVITDN